MTENPTSDAADTVADTAPPETSPTPQSAEATVTAQLSAHAVLYPGLADLVTTLGRALARAGGQEVRATLAAVETVTAQQPRERDCVRVSASPSSVLEFDPHLLGPLVEALMGMRASASVATTVTASDRRVLRAHLVPALRPVMAALNPDVAAAFTLGEDTGSRAWNKVRADHLLEVAVDVDVDGTTGRLTVLCPAAAPERPTANPDVLAALATMRVPLSVTLPTVDIPTSRLAALAVGDVLTLSGPETPWLLHAASTLLGTGRLGHVGDRVALILDTTTKETPMDTPVTDVTTTGTSATEAALEADVELGVYGEVAIAVTVEAGRISMPLHQLVALHEGQVLRLDRSPSAPVDVLANGKKVATAQSVTVDGQLALRVLSIEQP